MLWKELLAFLVFFDNSTSSSPPCADVIHSECREDLHPFDENDMPNKDACQIVCTAYGEKCHFIIFDNEPFARGNCRLYNADFSKYILNCNELAGPKTSIDGCDFLSPPDNTCQVYRSGNCEFGEVQETQYHSSWELCQAACKSTSECQLWRFEKEEKLCLILYSQERKCTWEFLPREPSLEDCDDNPPTPMSTTSTTINPTCEIPEAQQYGDWFCPASSSINTATCHLECHPGYVSNYRTAISCTDGIWSSSPVCVEAIGLITGSNYGDNPGNTVEVYGVGIHQMLPNLPDRRDAHSVDFVDGYIILCGGEVTATSCLELNSSLKWRRHSILTSPRAGHSRVSMLGQLHLLSGLDPPSTAQYTTEYLSPATSTTWIPGHDVLIPTFSACAAKIHPEVFILVDIAAVISYNVTSGAATRLQDMILPRMSHGCLYLKDSQSNFQGILVAGGQDQLFWGTVLSESELFDLSTGQWTNTGTLTIPRSTVRLMKLGEQIFALGGGDKTDLAIVDRFNMTTKTWSAAEEMLQARSAHAVTGVPPNLVKKALN